MKRKILSCFLGLTLILTTLSGCVDEEFWDEEYLDEDVYVQTSQNNQIIPDAASTKNTGTDWAIYWYLCGSDLETYNGSATDDLNEMMNVELPEGVKVVIQTGGTQEWKNNIIDASCMQRYVYDCNGFSHVEDVESANMGSSEVLADFLSFASENYPADRTMVNFWNHGGGSLTGAAFDELYGGDSLSLDEMYASFESVFGTENDTYPIDIVGFDTCLMATIDTAATFCPFANYLVASEELEPGNGWDYTGFLSAIAENPTISPVDIGVAICDTYAKGCEEYGTEDEITLSVTDLSKIMPLVESYDKFGFELLNYAVTDTTIFNKMSRIANKSENYGGNTREQGYTNMVDLGQFTNNLNEYAPENSEAVLTALENAVVYKIDSIYRPDGTGLSCYYPFDSDITGLETYYKVSPNYSFNYLYCYGLTGYLDENSLAELNEYFAEFENEPVEELPVVQNINSVGENWEDMPLTINDEGCATIDLGAEAYDALSSITFELYYTSHDEDDTSLLCLGTDNNMTGDWETGVFSENFTGNWGCIDGSPCYMEIVFEGEDYNEYAVPVLLNGEEYNLTVIYDYLREAYFINGARKPLSESGAADKNIVELQVGDTIEPIHYASDLESESDELLPFTIDPIIVTEETYFADEFLGDGYYYLMFVMKDAQGNTAYSSVATFDITGEDITTSVD